MTIRESIIKFLEENDGLQFGGHIARNVAMLHECKESNVERRIRELENEGKIERQLVENPSGGNKVVAYRLKPMQKPENPTHWKPEVALQKLINESQKSLL